MVRPLELRATKAGVRFWRKEIQSAYIGFILDKSNSKNNIRTPSFRLESCLRRGPSVGPGPGWTAGLPRSWTFGSSSLCDAKLQNKIELGIKRIAPKKNSKRCFNEPLDNELVLVLKQTEPILFALDSWLDSIVAVQIQMLFVRLVD